MFGFMSAYTSAAETPVVAVATMPAMVKFTTRDQIDYKVFGDESIRVLLNRNTGEDKITTWALVEETENAKIWRGTVVGSEWSPFRVTMSVFASKRTIEKALLDTAVLLKLDEMTERMIVLHNDDKEGRISLRHFTSKGMFPIAGREFVMVTYATDLPDGRLAIASRSLELDDVAPFEGYVRARNLVTGYVIEEKQDARGAVYCEVTLLAHCDLGGYIPATVVNMLGTSATVKVLANLKTYLEK